jgi:protein-tyrosine phosphatase
MCRSPVAAALFRRHAAGLRNPVLVGSAGLLDGGNRSPSEILSAMEGFGIDLTDHHSKQVTPEVVDEADVVVGMARRHAREVVLLDPDAWSRTFTLKELVRRGEKLGPRQPEESVSAWLDQLHQGRERMDLVGRSSEDDVSDPLGGPMSAYKASAREIDDLTGRLTSLLFTPSEFFAPQA